MPSMAADLRPGNRLDLPWLAGKVVELGVAQWRHHADQPRGLCRAEAIHERRASLKCDRGALSI